MGERPATDDLVRRDQLGKWWPSLAGRYPERLAVEKRGPPYVKLGRWCWYRVRDVDAWLAAETDRQMAKRDFVHIAKKETRRPKAPSGGPRQRLSKREKFLASRSGRA